MMMHGHAPRLWRGKAWMPPFSTQASAVAFFPIMVSPKTHR